MAKDQLGRCILALYAVIFAGLLAIPAAFVFYLYDRDGMRQYEAEAIVTGTRSYRPTNSVRRYRVSFMMNGQEHTTSVGIGRGKTFFRSQEIIVKYRYGRVSDWFYTDHIQPKN